MVIKDKKGTVIGLYSDVQWMDVREMKPISKKFKLKLKDKEIAAAWFVSNCIKTSSTRQYYVENLN